MTILVLLICQAFMLSSCFAFLSPQNAARSTSARGLQAFFDDWELLSDDRGVWKQVITEGPGDVPDKGSTLKIGYKGTLIGEDWWTPEDVVTCWLSELQGMDQFSEAMLAQGVDGAHLLDPDRFTEDFVQEKLEISNKIQCKKLVMAARRLQKVREDFPVEFEFDSNDEYSINAKKRIIRSLRLALESMKVGEEAKVVCRSDYGYSADGLRKNNGDIMVPPFATLCFDVTLLNAFEE